MFVKHKLWGFVIWKQKYWVAQKNCAKKIKSENGPAGHISADYNRMIVLWLHIEESKWQIRKFLARLNAAQYRERIGLAMVHKATHGIAHTIHAADIHAVRPCLLVSLSLITIFCGRIDRWQTPTVFEMAIHDQCVGSLGMTQYMCTGMLQCSQNVFSMVAYFYFLKHSLTFVH